MEKIIYFSLILFLFNPIKGQNFEWAVRAGGGHFDAGQGIGMDKQGNAFVLGTYMYTGDFGQFTLTSTNSTIFISKFNSNGNLLWLNQAGSSAGTSEAQNITVDSAGNSYITGYFSGTVTFDGQNGSSQTLTSPGINSVFILKYNTHGLLMWATKAEGGPYYSIGPRDIDIDSLGNSYITGNYCGQMTFGNTIITTYDDTTTTRPPAYAYFVAKCDMNGNFVWAKSATGGNSEEPSAIGIGVKVDNMGNVYAGGAFSGMINFSGTALQSDGYGSICIVKYDPLGNQLWVKKEGVNTAFEKLHIDKNNNLYIQGRGDNSMTIANTAVPHKTEYIAKFDKDFNSLWVKPLMSGAGGISDLKIDSVGNFYVSGGFNQTYVFGNGANSVTLQANKSASLFVAKYDSTASLKWAMQSGSDTNSWNDVALALCIDNKGGIYITGQFVKGTVMGTTTLTAAYTNYYAEDIFVAKIKEQSLTAINETENAFGFSIYPNPTNGIFQFDYTTSENDAIINIINAQGQNVYHKVLKQKQSVSALTESVDLSKEGKGIYFIEMIAGNKKSAKKIVRE